MKNNQPGIFLGLGSNLGDRENYLRDAINRVQEHPAFRLLQCSSFYQCPPWGNPDQPWFLNAVIEMDTSQAPDLLLKELKSMEKRLGRQPTHVRWGPREIDMDILLYRDVVMETNRLTIPHKHCTERVFVLKPLLEIAPGLIHPATGIPFREYLETTSPKDKEQCSLYFPEA